MSRAGLLILGIIIYAILKIIDVMMEEDDDDEW